ncbi:SDH family Clp fold serine proteinase [Agrobacterium pusense]|uniref:SDH family Clp fold serine proteinase n=1 Tax=Agrobacterium pusense TaxID=648995 RepID=UPI002FDE2811
MDVFLYNGEIKRTSDLVFIEKVNADKKSDECLVILVTPGGNPDAAYKMARYLQHRYSKYRVLIPGYCKSAGTLFALGAYEIIFAPYGELGPLDVQMAKTDRIAGLESGLNISEAFLTLEARARETYQNVISDILSSSGGIVSFQTASHAAAEIVTSLYGPIFSRIDPEEVGSRSRAMRIGENYGERLALKWENLKNGALTILSQDYNSHGFVIDFLEAQEFFHRVRLADETEMKLILDLGVIARHPQRQLTVETLSDMYASNLEGSNDDSTEEPNATESAEIDGVNSKTGKRAQNASSRSGKANATRKKRDQVANDQGEASNGRSVLLTYDN